MAYWLIVTGTGERPHVDGDWVSRERDWVAERGSIHMFSRRPSVVEGDRLVSYAAGSHLFLDEGRFFKLSIA